MLTIPKFIVDAPALPNTALRIGKQDNRVRKFPVNPKAGTPTALGIQFSLKPLSDKGYFTLFFFKLVDAKGNDYRIDVALKEGHLFLSLHNYGNNSVLTRTSTQKLSLFEWNTITLNWDSKVEKNWSFIVNGFPETKLSRAIDLKIGEPDRLEFTQGFFNEDIALLGNLIVTDAPIIMPLNDPQTYRQHAYINFTSVAQAVNASKEQFVFDSWYFLGMDQLSQIVGSFDCAASGALTIDLLPSGFLSGTSLSVTWVDPSNGARIRRFIYAEDPIITDEIRFLSHGELVPKRFHLEVWLNPGKTRAILNKPLEFVSSRAVTVRPIILNPFATVII